MNKTNNYDKKYEQILNSKIGKLGNNDKGKLYRHLKSYYHDNKKVNYRAITKILFGESLFLRPQYPPLIGPGIVSDQKSLQFIVPNKRVEQIKNESTSPLSRFVLRFLNNEESQSEEEFKGKKTEKEKEKEKENKFINFTINDKHFQNSIQNPFLIDLKLFDRETNIINFETKKKNFQIVVVFQHMCKIDLNTIVSAIVQRKTIPAEQIKLLLPKYIESSTKNTKAKTNTSTNFHKPQKKFQIVSMKCPLSRQPIKVPARSKKCSHLQCFDLGNFLLHSENTQTWRCPICRQQAKLEDLLIDGYLKNAFEKNRLYGEGKIQIFSDGKYNVINTNPEKIQFSLQQNSIFRIQSNSMHRNVPQSKNVGLNMNMNMSMSMKTNMKMKMNTNTNISNNDTGNGRKRDLLKILPAQKDLTTSSFNAIQQQQKKKNQKFGIRPNQQNQIESTIFALRKLSNCKSFQSSVLTIKK